MPDQHDQTSDTAPVTGVARGNLGTASNLDDTQVFHIADLAPSYDADGIPYDEPPPGPPEPPSPDDDDPNEPPPEAPYDGTPRYDAPGEGQDDAPPMDAPRREPPPMQVAAVAAAPPRPRATARAATTATERSPGRWVGFIGAAIAAILIGGILGMAGNDPAGTGQDAPTLAPAVTPAPTPDGGDGKSKSDGKGKGNNGNGNGNKN